MAQLNPVKYKSKNATEVLIRHAVENDAQSIWDIARSVLTEEIYQLMTAEEFKLTIDDEKKWINSFIDRPHSILLVAEVHGQVVGMLDFHVGHRQRIAHVGNFAVSILKDFRNLGFGSMLLQTLNQWALSTNKIEKINLQVHATNQQAIATYLKNGYIIEGVRKNELKYSDSTYVDAILMARFLK